MKRAASCKHRQAVKTIQCAKKLSVLTYILIKLEKCVEKHATSHIQEDSRQHGKPSCPLVVVKTKVKSVFLL